jgi:3-carboxy-cis,cis-muconate cycloisomerase
MTGNSALLRASIGNAAPRMTVSPFDHPILSGLPGDEAAARHFSAEAELAAMLAFESALAQAQAEHGVIGRDAAETISAAIAGFRPDMAKLRAGVAKDGVVVPELVRQLRDIVGKPHGTKAISARPVRTLLTPR